MSRYLLFITHSEDYRDQPIPQGLEDAMGEFIDEHLKSGVLIETNGLRPTSESARVRLSRGKVTVTDGPFTEAKEVIGGYVLIEAGSMQQAIDLATKFMDIHRVHWPQFEGSCEVRPIDAGVPAAPPAAAASEAASS